MARPMAPHEALAMLHQVMHAILHQRISMAIKTAGKLRIIFIIIN
jgi:hypothetical protein